MASKSLFLIMVETCQSFSLVTSLHNINTLQCESHVVSFALILNIWISMHNIFSFPTGGRLCCNGAREEISIQKNKKKKGESSNTDARDNLCFYNDMVILSVMLTNGAWIRMVVKMKIKRQGAHIKWGKKIQRNRPWQLYGKIKSRGCEKITAKWFLPSGRARRSERPLSSQTFWEG